MITMKYILALSLALLTAAAGTAQTTQECYPGLGTCDEAGDTGEQPQMKIDIGTPDDPAEPQEESSAPEAPAPSANRVCHVHDVRPPDDWLAIRTEPSTRTGTRLAKLPSGTALEMLGSQQGNWHLVRLTNGRIGWVSWATNRWIAC